MTIKKPSLVKPVASETKGTNFFDKALNKAKESVSDEPKIVTEPAKPLKSKKTNSDTTRENFDLDPELRDEMRIFLATSRKFRTKRDFLTQCLIDGLEKYKGQ